MNIKLSKINAINKKFFIRQERKVGKVSEANIFDTEKMRHISMESNYCSNENQQNIGRSQSSFKNRRIYN